MNFETGPRMLSPQERQEAMQFVLQWQQTVAAMGANDEEMPKAQRILQWLQSDSTITKEAWEKEKDNLGDPFDKNTNYH